MSPPALDPQAAWQPVLATVVSCRRTWDTWFVNETTPDEVGNYQLARFLVRFSYQVGTRFYAGQFVAGAPHLPGDVFPITFNPDHPEQHTGSDPKRSLLARVLMWLAALTGVGLLLHFFPNAGW